MKAVEIVGDIDENRQLHAEAPEGLPAGPVRLIVLFPDEDEAGTSWSSGVAAEWFDDLCDPRQDIYSSTLLAWQLAP